MAKVEDELRELQLEQTRFQVGQLRGQETMRKIRARAIEQSLQADLNRTEQATTNCAHRKGGKGIEMMHKGNDSNYAVIKHQLPHGPIIVVCQRCPKVWTPPDPALISRGATVEMRKDYARQLRDYNEALNFPTDNEMSGSQLFLISQPTVPLSEAV